MGRLMNFVLLVLFTLVISGCGGGGNSIVSKANTDDTTSNENSNDEFNRTSYKGLLFYHKNLPSSAYKLEQLSDSEFNSLNSNQKLQVANKLLNTLFFGYRLKTLKEKIDNGNFISSVRAGLEVDSTDRAWLESYIRDDDNFKQYTNRYYLNQVNLILARFYAAKKLDKYFFENWVAYILTQTILFSPAYELTNTHTPNISSVYNRIVNMLDINSGMRYITYVHMMSEDNWRRFRSPEDNGREMLEIYLKDTNDKHVPLAGKALQNWSLNEDGDTLEVGLNKNTKPINLFGTTVYTGEDFYRELVKSDAFVSGVTSRLVDFFFPNKSNSSKATITSKIVSSHPETWQDILLQIVFSKEYLLHNSRPQSAEETFFSLAKKIGFRAKRDTLKRFREYLESMHQASMKYKLGKIDRVPLDTLSFAYYHRYIRLYILLRHAKTEQTNRDSWNYVGWLDSFIEPDKFPHDSRDDVASLRGFVNYLFESTIGRSAKEDEFSLFKNHMIEKRDGKELFKWEFNIFITRDDPQDQEKRQRDARYRIAYSVLDYISRLEETYAQGETK